MYSASYSVDVHYKISMPTETGLITFDEFLFVFGLCEDTSLDVEHKYDLCRKVDNRLIEFLRYSMLEVDCLTIIGRNQKLRRTIMKPKSQRAKSNRFGRGSWRGGRSI